MPPTGGTGGLAPGAPAGLPAAGAPGFTMFGFGVGGRPCCRRERRIVDLSRSYLALERRKGSFLTLVAQGKRVGIQSISY